MRVRFTPEARASVRDKRAWWELHREKAPQLFVEELVAVVHKLREGEDADRQRYGARGGRIVWRLLVPKTRHHVYYRIDEVAREIEVLLVWNAIAGRTPDL